MLDNSRSGFRSAAVVLLASSVALLAAAPPRAIAADEVPPQIKPWLVPQKWQRDTDEPALSLGEKGAFDDTHMFAPMVARDGQRFLMWYCGSRGFAYDLSKERTPDERVFSLGLATSDDGKRFMRSGTAPAFSLDDKRRSVLTPTVLRNPDGSLVREDGKLRMWFSSATFSGGGAVQSIQETTSADGVSWSQPSEVQIERAYAPSVIKTDAGYEMWYTVPGKYPWLMMHARSDDGRRWSTSKESVLNVSQDWERYVQIYPSVMKIGDVYLMWYASYWKGEQSAADEDVRNKTAIGFAASLDGERWYKHPQNPVLRPDPRRSWESHYASSQSVVRLADGSFRIWYASRKAPPFKNLYFSLNTAHWAGPTSESDSSEESAP
jgi:hypothetical protein